MTPAIREAAGAVPPTGGGAMRGLINSVPKAREIKISPWDVDSCSWHGSGRHPGLQEEPGIDSFIPCPPRIGEVGVHIPAWQN